MYVCVCALPCPNWLDSAEEKRKLDLNILSFSSINIPGNTVLLIPLSSFHEYSRMLPMTGTGNSFQLQSGTFWKSEEGIYGLLTYNVCGIFVHRCVAWVL